VPGTLVQTRNFLAEEHPAGNYLRVTVDAKFNMNQQRVFNANKAEQLCYVEGGRLMDTITLPFLAMVRYHWEIRA